MSFQDTPIKTFGLNYIEIVKRFVIGIICLWMGSISLPTGIFVFQLDGNSLYHVLMPIIGFGAGTYFLLHAVWTIITFPNISVHRSGLHLQSFLGNKTLSWSEITSIGGGLTKHTLYHVIPLFTRGHYSLYNGSKVIVRVGNTTAHIQEFYTLISKAISSANKAKYVKQLQNGETLEFGKVKLNRTSINVGSIFLSMNDVKGVQTNEDYLFIYSNAQERPWKSFALDDLPNPWLFRDLVNGLAKQRQSDH